MSKINDGAQYYYELLLDKPNSKGQVNTNRINDFPADYSYLHKIMIKLNIPAIYSSNERQFQWVKNLGIVAIEKVELKLSFSDTINTKISLFTYTEWLFIWNEVNSTTEDKEMFDELIGNTKDMYDPANAYNRNGLYPSSHLKQQTYKWVLNDENVQQATTTTITTDYNYNKPPSINAKTLYIPLNFYFCNNIKESLSLKQCKITDFIIKFRKLEELYTVLLVPEDFQIPENTSLTNTPASVSPDTVFVNNESPVFSTTIHMTTSTPDATKISLFDVISNKYRIKPSSMNTSGINNFMKETTSVSNVSSRLILSTFYSNYVKPTLIFNLIKSNITPLKKIKCKGLFNDVVSKSIFTNMQDEGQIREGIYEINRIKKTNVKELFFVFRHDERKNKNDILNFTNLDYNNTIQWENEFINSSTKSFSSNIDLKAGTLWDHLNSSNSIRFTTDNEGMFSIKKYILDNNTGKYKTILNYSNKSSIVVPNLIWNAESANIYTEGIVSEFNIKFDRNLLCKSSQNYTFFNKTTVYQNYKKTLPGLYYINKPTENNTFELVELTNTTVNKISIKNTLNQKKTEYKLLLYMIEEKIIQF